MQQKSLRVALTGGIGSGKTTIATIFCNLGVPIIDFDGISRSLTQGTQSIALTQIREHFGDSVFEHDGTLSRSRLRELIFNSPTAKKSLENILHPLIRAEALHQYESLAQTSTIVIFDMPLLVESAAWQAGLDKILVIDCNEETQVTRVVQRSGWEPEQVKAVIRSQASRSERLAIATHVIVNDGITLQDLHAQVSCLLHQWQQEKI